nr:hypothetical protein [uncultured Methylophaga sp.]
MEEDWRRIKQLWAESSLTFKVIQCISVFLTVSSVTSLSEKIIEWRGFIKDGIDFYHNSISLPIISILQTFNLNIDQPEFDWLIITGILFGMIIRYWWFPNPFESIKLNIIASVVFVLLYLRQFYILAVSGLPTEDSFPWSNFVLLFMATIVIPIISLDNSKRFLFLSPLILVVFLFFCLAAINKGLAG